MEKYLLKYYHAHNIHFIVYYFYIYSFLENAHKAPIPPKNTNADNITNKKNPEEEYSI